MTTRKVLETVKLVKPVRATPIKRFDRKDIMERDLERYRAEARARLLRNGFDIPPFLMPKPKPIEDDDDEVPLIDPDAQRDIRSPVMTGPKPAPIARSRAASSGDPSADRVGTSKVKPSRHIHVQNGGGGSTGAVQMTRSAAQAAAVAREKSAYEEYLESLNGAPTLLDSARDQNGRQNASATESVKGRVDDFKEKEVRQSRIDLPDNTSNWAGRDALDQKRSAKLEKQAKSASSSGSRAPVNWNKVLSRFAAYMIAAVAVGYVLVLTVNEFALILMN